MVSKTQELMFLRGKTEKFQFRIKAQFGAYTIEKMSHFLLVFLLFLNAHLIFRVLFESSLILHRKNNV